MQWVTVAGMRRYWGNQRCKATLLGEPAFGIGGTLVALAGVGAQKVMLQESISARRHHGEPARA